MGEREAEFGEGEAEFAEYFRINTCAEQILRHICRLYVFLMRKSAQEN